MKVIVALLRNYGCLGGEDSEQHLGLGDSFFQRKWNLFFYV